MKKTSKKKRLKKILIVEDDPKIRKVISEFLGNNYNVQIIEAENGLDAISKTFNYRFNAVISDLEMPEMNGLEFMGYLKTKSEFDKIPKLFLTSNKKVFYREKAKKVGVNIFLSKPFKSKELRKHLDEVFGII